MLLCRYREALKLSVVKKGGFKLLQIFRQCLFLSSEVFSLF